jgi:hypothetical protein
VILQPELQQHQEKNRAVATARTGHRGSISSFNSRQPGKFARLFAVLCCLTAFLRHENSLPRGESMRAKGTCISTGENAWTGTYAFLID